MRSLLKGIGLPGEDSGTAAVSHYGRVVEAPGLPSRAARILALRRWDAERVRLTREREAGYRHQSVAYFVDPEDDALEIVEPRRN
jgi:hypothetical protein